MGAATTSVAAAAAAVVDVVGRAAERAECKAEGRVESVALAVRVTRRSQ